MVSHQRIASFSSAFALAVLSFFLPKELAAQEGSDEITASPESSPTPEQLRQWQVWHERQQWEQWQRWQRWKEQGFPNQGWDHPPPPPGPAKPKRKKGPSRWQRAPDQLHLDVSVGYAAMWFVADYEVRVREPGFVADGAFTEKISTGGPSLQGSIGWTRYRAGAGLELQYLRGRSQAFDRITPPEAGLENHAESSVTSVYGYIEVRPLERWLSLRLGPGVTFMHLDHSNEAIQGGAWGPGLMASFRVSAPLTEELRFTFGGSARAIVNRGLWDLFIGAAFADLRLGVEYH